MNALSWCICIYVQKSIGNLGSEDFVRYLPSSSSQSVLEYQPYSLADLPVSIFGNFFADRHDKRLRYLQDVRARLLSRVGTHPHDLLTTDDVIIDDGIPNIR